jgi:predicted  nucleic acid-binding Zn-ribbon protein
MEEAPFKCLRCGHEFKAPYVKKVPMERACPKCNSNSVRRMKEAPKRAEA